jgi:hypothetical protein
VRSHLAAFPDTELVEIKRADRPDGTLGLAVTARSSFQMPYDEVLAFQKDVATRLQRSVALSFTIIPTTRLDPLVPPTFTATPAPTLSPALTWTATATPIPPETPTATPTTPPTGSAKPPAGTYAATATTAPTATASPVSTPTNTPTPSPAPTASATSTATPTGTPTPSPAPAAVFGTGGRGVLLRREPGGPIMGGLSEGTAVLMFYGQLARDGRTWTRVLAPSGLIGWVADEYLRPAALQR